MQFKESILCVFLILLFLLGPASINTSWAQQKTQTWQINNLKKIGRHKPTVWGNPTIIKGKGGKKALQFDGQDDGLLIDNNPVAGAKEFTIEVVFKPLAAYPKNIEQRFLHIQDPANENRRILMELRLNCKNEWYGDWFIKTENGGLTLIDSTKTHPVNQWATISLVYKNKQLKGYINGKEELAGEIEYLPISAAAKTTVGVRMNKRSWFNGIIQEIRFSHQALTPKL